MRGYKHILLGVDLSDESYQVVEQGAALRDAFSAKLSIIHVIEPLTFAYGGDIPLDFSGIQEEIQKQATVQLNALADKYGIPADARHIVVGKPETEIHHAAEKGAIDLVVVGSHGRHGLALILGSTSNAVLHGAKCDVLAVRIQDDE